MSYDITSTGQFRLGILGVSLRVTAAPVIYILCHVSRPAHDKGYKPSLFSILFGLSLIIAFLCFPAKNYAAIEYLNICSRI